MRFTGVKVAKKTEPDPATTRGPVPLSTDYQAKEERVASGTWQ